MPRTAQFKPAVGGGSRRDAADLPRKTRPPPPPVQRGGGAGGPRQLVAAPAEGVGQRQQDPPHLLVLLLLERDDVVVDLDGAERLEEQAGGAGGTAVHDSRDRRAVLGPDHQYVGPVAIGHHLLLQILRCVLAAQVGLQRAPQPRPLLAQALAYRLQLGAGVVQHVAARIDLAADIGDLALERRRWFDDGGEAREGGAGATDDAGGGVDRGEERGQ